MRSLPVVPSSSQEWMSETGWAGLALALLIPEQQQLLQQVYDATSSQVAFLTKTHLIMDYKNAHEINKTSA
jgi:hypothetical protein